MLLYGAGGHAQVIAYNLNAQGNTLKGVFDDNPEKKKFLEHTVKHLYDSSFTPEEEIILALGDNRIRQAKSGVITHKFGNVIHPSAQVFQPESIGLGTVIFQNVVVQTGTNIGGHVILNTGVILEHNSRLENFVHLGPRSTVCGQVFVGEGTLIGAGATVIPGIYIGKWCVIGAGAVVTKDIPDYSVAVGMPARVISSRA